MYGQAMPWLDLLIEAVVFLFNNKQVEITAKFLINCAGKALSRQDRKPNDHHIHFDDVAGVLMGGTNDDPIRRSAIF